MGFVVRSIQLEQILTSSCTILTLFCNCPVALFAIYYTDHKYGQPLDAILLDFLAPCGLLPLDSGRCSSSSADSFGRSA